MLEHTHAKWKTAINGRFIIHKHLHLGSRGPQGESEYVVEDTGNRPAITHSARSLTGKGVFRKTLLPARSLTGNKGKRTSCDNLMMVKCVIFNAMTGIAVAPWFGGAPTLKELGVDIKLFEHGEYQEIVA